jgi:hypothetical protein
MHFSFNNSDFLPLWPPMPCERLITGAGIAWPGDTACDRPEAGVIYYAPAGGLSPPARVLGTQKCF